MFLLLIFKSFFSLLEGLIKNNCKQVRVGLCLFTYLVTCHIICQEALCFFNLCMGMPIVLRSFCDLHVSYYLHSIRPTHTEYQSAFVVITPRPNRLLIKVNEPTLLTSQYQNIPHKQQKIMNIEIILLAQGELGPYLCMQVIKNDLKIIEIIHF